MNTRTAYLLLFLLQLTACSSDTRKREKLYLLREDNLKTFYKVAESPLMDHSKDVAWRIAAPQVQSVTIPSTSDDQAQPALFYDSGTPRRKPLLVVLHSWSADYKQHFSIPYGVWAVRNDWVFIHPNYRGPFTGPQATASEKAVQDVLDAVSYALSNARIDSSRIYLAGFSGGAMMSLIMAGRYPDIWAGAVAWVPVYDLVDWYHTTRGAVHDYSGHIENSCGGAPVEGSEAFRECKKRSPSSYLENARGKEVQVYIGTGIKDGFVPPSHALEAFNALAEPSARFDSSTIDSIVKNEKLPPELRTEEADSLYADAGIKLLLRRRSNNAVISLFDSRHDVIYNAGLVWLSGQRRRER